MEIIKYLLFLMLITTGISICLCLFSIFMYKALEGLDELLNRLR